MFILSMSSVLVSNLKKKQKLLLVSKEHVQKLTFTD